MAATIPYPNLVFVPLDILTAEELNEVQANISAIAAMFPLKSSDIGSKAISTTQLNDAAVTLAKMATNSVGTTQIQDDAITAAKMGIPYVAQVGELNVPGITAGNGITITTDLKNPSDTNYFVFYAGSKNTNDYSWLRPTTEQRNAANFKTTIWNDGNNTTQATTISYVIIRP